MTRRELFIRLLGLAASGALPVSSLSTAMAGSETQASGQPFSQDWLRETAQRLAQEPYVAPSDARPPWLVAMDYDDYQALNNFRIDHSLWAGGELPFQTRFFHLGLNFHHPVSLYEVVNGLARPLDFSPEMFKYGPRVKDKIPEQVGNLGFAGFRVNARSDWDRDMFSFLGPAISGQSGPASSTVCQREGWRLTPAWSARRSFPPFARSGWSARR